MAEIKTLYNEDFLAWSLQQAAALRAAARTGSNQQLDWENLAEEIEDLGKSLRRELRSQIRRIIQHLVKLEYSAATDPRRGWRASIRDAREEIHDLLADSPSLARELSQLVSGQTVRGIREAVNDLEERGETASVDLARVRGTSYTPDQVFGDWFPPDPERLRGSAQ